MSILRKRTDDIYMKYLWAVLSSEQFRDIIRQESTGSNINNLNSGLGNIKVPLPPVSTQKQIAADIEHFEDEERRLKSKLGKYQEEIDNIVNACFTDSYTFEQIGNVADIYNGGTPSTEKEEFCL